jgi:chromosome segregation ATPase
MSRQIREQHSKVQKRKERLLRELKRAETQLRNGKDELSSATMTIEKLQLKVSFYSFEKISNLKCLFSLSKDRLRII